MENDKLNNPIVQEVNSDTSSSPDIQNHKKTKTLAISLFIVIVAGTVFYFLFNKIKQDNIEDARLKRIAESAAWLDTQVVDMTKEEKQAIGKSLDKQAKTIKQTDTQKQATLDFLNS